MLRHAPTQELKEAYDRLCDTINMIDVGERFMGEGFNRRSRCGPCPKCGGKDRWHINFRNPMLWACRHCHPRYGDAIEFYRWYYNQEFWAAVAMLHNHVNGGTVVRTARVEMINQRQEKPKEWKKDAWQSVSRSLIESSQMLLPKSAALKYLHGRGFTDSTIQDFELGYQKHKGIRDAVVIPWRYSDGTVTAVRYRFFDEKSKDKKHRFTSHFGSESVLFGAHLWQGHDMLVMLEGEMNAMAVYQMTTKFGMPVDVGSFGGEANHSSLADTCKMASKTLLWYDNPAKLEKAMEIIREARVDGVVGMTSEQDANELLLAGGEQVLYDTLLKMLFV